MAALRHRRFEILLTLIILLLVGYPYAQEVIPGDAPLLVMRIAVLLATLHVLTDRRRLRWVGTAFFALATAGSLFADSSGQPGILGAAVGCELALYLLAITALSAEVFHRGGVGRGALFGAACAYFLIALAFASAFELAALAAPGSFSPPDPDHYTLVYFSLVTLTTLGYGDVLPATDAVRSLVVLECVTGILYMAVVVARLVNLYVGRDASAPFRPPSLDKAGPALGRLEILFGLLVLQLATYPYIPFGVTRAMAAAVVLAALFAVGTGRRTLWIGAALVAAALAGLTWPGAWIWGQGLLTACFFAATATLAGRLFRRGNVDRDVLFGAGCVYLLIGASWAAAYTLVERLAPGSYLLSAEAPSAYLLPEMVYYSFVTLTTLGYGDVLPQNAVAHSLAVLEAAVGVLFPAVLVARLVALYR